ncbi:MAG: glycoside hydrolase family 71/99-like protein [Bacteroidota bacterium]|nr:glycoside hydrolase family 71/99-like protein [Bacteroidota bacterium]
MISLRSKNYFSFIAVFVVIFSLQNKLSAQDNQLIGKVFCGYQGWFNCYGDGSAIERWFHWSGGTYKSNAGYPEPGHLNFEIYPDISEYDSGSLFQTGFADLGDGRPAKLFSSYKSEVMNKHFEWMQTYGIDGVALQRFLGETKDGVFRTGRDSIAVRMKRAAQKYQKLFYIMYDMGADDTTYFKNDWTHMVKDLKITDSPYYTTQNGKPVVCIWGFGFNTRPNLPASSLAIINWLKKNGYYVIGGVPTDWRLGINDSFSGYESVYKAFNMISPWTVGRGAVVNNTYKTTYMQPDYAYCKVNNIDYQPVIFSGFAWSNWNSNKVNEIPRKRGDLLWQQVYNIKNMGIPSMYVAMFDEYDEGTAIIKAADSYFSKPTNQYFLTMSADGTYISSDFYLRLVGKATRVFKGLDPLTSNVTIPYSVGPIWFRTSVESGIDAVILTPNQVESKLNVVGLGGSGSPVCLVTSSGVPHSGSYSIKFSGNDNSSTSSYCSFMAFDVDIPVSSDLQLSYWSYPLNENGRYVGIDLLMTDGSRLRNLDLVDLNGVPMKPSQGRGTVNAWTQTVCNVGQWLNGKTIDKILVTYDQAANTGDFSGYIDDIIIENGSVGTSIKNSTTQKDQIRIYPTLLHKGDICVDATSLNQVYDQCIMTVMNMQTETLIKRSFMSGEQFRVSLQSLSPGVYLVVVKGKNYRQVEKIIKY